MTKKIKGEANELLAAVRGRLADRGLNRRQAAEQVKDLVSQRKLYYWLDGEQEIAAGKGLAIARRLGIKKIKLDAD